MQFERPKNDGSNEENRAFARYDKEPEVIPADPGWKPVPAYGEVAQSPVAEPTPAERLLTQLIDKEKQEKVQ